MEEIWKDIPDYEGYYQVSNFGNFRSLKRLIKYKSYGIRLYPAKNLLTETTKDNYQRIVLMKDGIKHRFMAHILVAKTFIPNPDNKPEVNHIDGNKSNNVVSNLEWVTASENTLHAIRIGLCNPYINIPSNSKAVKCLDTQEIFKSIHKAAIWLGVNTTSLSRSIKGNRSCKGKTFVFV